MSEEFNIDYIKKLYKEGSDKKKSSFVKKIKSEIEEAAKNGEKCCCIASLSGYSEFVDMDEDSKEEELIRKLPEYYRCLHEELTKVGITVDIIYDNKRFFMKARWAD